MKIAIGIPTLGRRAVVAQSVERLLRQDRPPDLIIVIAPTEADLGDVQPDPTVVLGVSDGRGACRQRNHILLEARQRGVDVLAFLDDDYVAAPSFMRRVERLFAEHPEVVGASGRVLKDGIHGSPISFEEADRIVAAYECELRGDYAMQTIGGAYGCNMVIRLSAAEGLEFDEQLPLYGWQEDIDFTNRVSRTGRFVQTDAFAGVHLGMRGGRISGKRLGYSQVVNPSYLVQKGTMQAPYALKLVSRNLAANVAKSFRPEPHIDRRGRLSGNLLGLKELLLGRAHPTRILDIHD